MTRTALFTMLLVAGLLLFPLTAFSGSQSTGQETMTKEQMQAEIERLRAENEALRQAPASKPKIVFADREVRGTMVSVLVRTDVPCRIEHKLTDGDVDPAVPIPSEKYTMTSELVDSTTYRMMIRKLTPRKHYRLDLWAVAADGRATGPPRPTVTFTTGAELEKPYPRILGEPRITREGIELDIEVTAAAIVAWEAVPSAEFKKLDKEPFSRDNWGFPLGKRDLSPGTRSTIRFENTTDGRKYTCLVYAVDCAGARQHEHAKREGVRAPRAFDFDGTIEITLAPSPYQSTIAWTATHDIESARWSLFAEKNNERVPLDVGAETYPDPTRKPTDEADGIFVDARDRKRVEAHTKLADWQDSLAKSCPEGSISAVQLTMQDKDGDERDAFVPRKYWAALTPKTSVRRLLLLKAKKRAG